MDTREVIEALIFSAAGALASREILKVVPDISEGDIADAVSELNGIYKDSGRTFRIERASAGYMFVTLERYAPFLRSLHNPSRLSPAALEVLAVIAYRCPCTKQTVDTIRGVDSSSSLKSLLKHQLIDVKPGKPMRYVTTERFLEVFGLTSLSDLPDLGQFEELFGSE
ncbi:MAG: SMC-Scp complex subunit ScpB [Desulfomonilia bacterium]|nr:SMC-Scp complex subunit ScpB [Desulfomonilia bacterium]